MKSLLNLALFVATASTAVLSQGASDLNSDDSAVASGSLGHLSSSVPSSSALPSSDVPLKSISLSISASSISSKSVLPSSSKSSNPSSSIADASSEKNESKESVSSSSIDFSDLLSDLSSIESSKSIESAKSSKSFSSVSTSDSEDKSIASDIDKVTVTHTVVCTECKKETTVFCTGGCNVAKKTFTCNGECHQEIVVATKTPVEKPEATVTPDKSKTNGVVAATNEAKCTPEVNDKDCPLTSITVVFTFRQCQVLTA